MRKAAGEFFAFKLSGQVTVFSKRVEPFRCTGCHPYPVQSFASKHPPCDETRFRRRILRRNSDGSSRLLCLNKAVTLRRKASSLESRMADDFAPPGTRKSRVQGQILGAVVPGYDEIELTGHACEQMQIRGFDEKDVIETLANPSQRGLSTQPGRQRVRRNKNARIACDVVYEESGKKIRVITVIKITRRLVERRSR